MTEPPGIPSNQRPQSRLPSLGPRGEGWFVLQIVLLGLIVAAGWLFGADWTGAPRFALALAGVVLLVASLALVFRGVRDLDRSLSPLPRPGTESALVQDGIYRRLRHPIYAGVILAAFGWSLLMASVAALALSLGLTLLLDLKARREEAWLQERFAAYAAYAARTRRFVPGLY